MWHTIFIAAHAAAATVALLAGLLALARGALFRTYLWSLVAMEVFLVLALAAEWAGVGVAAQALFAALAALGLYIVWRADQARRTQPKGYEGPSASYIAHVGFTLVALLDEALRAVDHRDPAPLKALRLQETPNPHGLIPVAPANRVHALERPRATAPCGGRGDSGLDLSPHGF